MNKEKLEKVGVACFGNTWQTEMARALNVNNRTVRRWASGETQVPSGVIDDLQRLINDKHYQLKIALNELTFDLPSSIVFDSEKFGNVIFFADKKDAYAHALKNHQDGIVYYCMLDVISDNITRPVYACKIMPKLDDCAFEHVDFVSPAQWSEKHYIESNAGVYVLR